MAKGSTVAVAGSKSRMTTSSIEQRSKDEHHGIHMPTMSVPYSGTLKGSRSTANLGPNAVTSAGSRVASKTALRKPGISIAN